MSNDEAYQIEMYAIFVPSHFEMSHSETFDFEAYHLEISCKNVDFWHDRVEVADEIR